MATVPAVAETGPFSVGERALVPFTDKNYEAKILKAEYREDGLWYYFVHYNGWNKKFDSWVEEVGMIKLPAGSEMPVPVTASAAPPGGAGPGAGPQPKTKRVTVKDKVVATNRPTGLGAPAAEVPSIMLELDMSIVLRKALLDDYDAIVEEGKLQPLPRSPSIADMLQSYVADAHQMRGNSESEIELSLGLRSYFDKTLLLSLLYRGEREQAVQVLSDNRVASCIFGAEHLLRLFVKLPELMALAITSESQAATVSIMVQDLMLWMTENADSIFMTKDQYIDASAFAVCNKAEQEKNPLHDNIHLSSPEAPAVIEAAH